MDILARLAKRVDFRAEVVGELFVALDRVAIPLNGPGLLPSRRTDSTLPLTTVSWTLSRSEVME